MKKIVLMVLGLLVASMFLVGCAEEVSDAEIEAELEQLSEEELDSLIEQGEAEEDKALAGQASSMITIGTMTVRPSTVLRLTYKVKMHRYKSAESIVKVDDWREVVPEKVDDWKKSEGVENPEQVDDW